MWRTPVAHEDFKKLRRDVKSQVEAAERRLVESGCAAADYRLTGSELLRLCCVRLDRDYRMVIGFPRENEIAVILIGRHVQSPVLNVYNRLYRILDVDNPAGARDKPPCCDGEGLAPVDEERVEHIVEQLRDSVRR